MLKKTVKYEDLDGNEVVEDFHFHMTKAEILETFDDRLHGRALQGARDGRAHCNSSPPTNQLHLETLEVRH